MRTRTYKIQFVIKIQKNTRPIEEVGEDEAQEAEATAARNTASLRTNQRMAAASKNATAKQMEELERER